jgi:hypothetical protein
MVKIHFFGIEKIVSKKMEQINVIIKNKMNDKNKMNKMFPTIIASSFFDRLKKFFETLMLIFIPINAP